VEIDDSVAETAFLQQLEVEMEAIVGEGSHAAADRTGTKSWYASTNPAAIA
jgi:hypothetical protein